MEYDRFRVKKYCQTDEESILLNLVDLLAPVPSYVVDIGAADGRALSNTQIFVEKGWGACRFDWKFEPDGETLHSEFVTRENIVALLEKYKVPQTFGILSLDIDGNDLYVLDALLEGYRPVIVVFEFNGFRPPESHDVIRYSTAFLMDGDYYGASWSAFGHVFGLHGYTLVHHSHSLNGYAVDAARGLEPTASLPPRVQYHPHNPEGVWLDAREMFPRR